MAELLRESPAGQLIRFFTKDKFLKYAEEKSDFKCPSSYAQHDAPPTTFHSAAAEAPPPMTRIDDKLENAPSPETENPPSSSGSSTPPTEADTPMEAVGTTATRTVTRPELLSRITSRVEMEKVTTRRDLERAYTDATLREAMKKEPTQPIIPEKTADGTILVDWYSTDDQDNPQNWSFGKKCVVIVQI
jgi:DHA1 family multidrug resistance protein-like MFS transporter